MPYSIEFPLRHIPPHGAAAPHLLRNNVYRWIQRADAALADQLHATDEKPFKVSTLAVHDGGASFRVTLLDDELYAPLGEGFRLEPFLTLHEHTYDFTDGIDEMGETYVNMAVEARAEAQIKLDFLTATAFHVAGQTSVLPEPRRVYESYARRWNIYAPEPLEIAPDWIDWVAASVVVSWLRIETRRMSFEAHVQIGFVGQVEFEARNHLSAHHLATFNCLSDYAFYCGTGHKTTQGMGQTRRI